MPMREKLLNDMLYCVLEELKRVSTKLAKSKGDEKKKQQAIKEAVEFYGLYRSHIHQVSDILKDEQKIVNALRQLYNKHRWNNL